MRKNLNYNMLDYKQFLDLQVKYKKLNLNYNMLDYKLIKSF